MAARSLSSTARPPRRVSRYPRAELRRLVPETLTMDLRDLRRALALSDAVELSGLLTVNYLEPTSGLEPLTC